MMNKAKKTPDPAPLHWPDKTRGLNNFERDHNLQRYLARVYPDLLAREAPTLESLGEFCGGRLDAQAEYSERVAPPKLIPDLDRTVAPDKRVGRVVLNEEYKDCQQELYRHGILAKLFDKKKPAPHMLTFTAQYMASYTDISTGCPLAMTHPDALILASRASKEVRDMFLPQYLRTDGKTMIGGTWATEWAGGSDVRKNTETVAQLKANGECEVNGRNFFTSAMGFDSWGAIKTVRLDQGQGEGIGLVFIPRFTDEKWDKPESERALNKITVTHIKEKSGTEGLATAEVELEQTTGYLLADESEGLRAMMEALSCSRVHNAMAAAGVMHRAYNEAMCWASHRETFGQTLITRPAVQEDLLTLKTEWLGGTALAFEAARSFDEALNDKSKQPWLRVVTALAKYRTAEKATECTALATELVGGIGYTKDHPIERINRDAMVLRVWEGPKNIQARDLVSVLSKGGSEAYLKRLRTIADELPSSQMKEEAHNIRRMHQAMTASLHDLDRSQVDQELVGPRYLKEMAKGLSYALLCEEAACELASHHDQSKLLVARSFYEQNYHSGYQPAFRRSALHENFNRVAHGEIIPVGKTGPDPFNAHQGPPSPGQ